MRPLTVLLTSFLMTGCVVVEGGNNDGNEPVGGSDDQLDEAGCPVDQPSDGSSCSEENKVCEYLVFTDDLDCDESWPASRCEGGVWVSYDWQCECTETLPEAGTDCLGHQRKPIGCSHTTDCGEGTAESLCGSYTNYLWEISYANDCLEP
jgi:hypothetical protein